MGSLQVDLRKYYRIEFATDRPPLWKRIKLWTSNLGFHCVAVYRLGRLLKAYRDSGNWFILPAYIPYEAACLFIKAVYHVDIFAADIGPGFYIGHIGTIYIGSSTIGSNLSIAHNVTIGLGYTGDSHGVPTLGDDVWIGAGSMLYGKIKIGNGVTINCGSILSRSLPDKSLAGGNPARLLALNHENGLLFRSWREGKDILIQVGNPIVGHMTLPVNDKINGNGASHAGGSAAMEAPHTRFQDRN